MLQQLIVLLHENKCSLEMLAHSLSISQHQLKQLFQDLDNKGIAIQRDEDGEVRFPASITPLSVDVIGAVLSEENQRLIKLDCRLVVDSTNQILLDSKPVTDNLCICSAEWQTEGRGRLNRAWISPMGQNLMFSMAREWRQGDPLVEAGMLTILSLMAGVAVASTLKALGLDGVKLKWPNDIVVKNAAGQLEKLAGILVESKTDSLKGIWVVGIGLNVVNVASWRHQVDQNITSISQLLTADFSREVILAGVIENWLELEQQLLEKGSKSLLDKWRKFDVLYGESLTVKPTNQDSFNGIGAGINDDGLLQIESQQGLESKILKVHSGEVKVRINHATTD